MHKCYLKALPFIYGVHQGSVLSPLLFFIVLEALSNAFWEGLSMELLYADDLVLLADTIGLLYRKLGIGRLVWRRKV